MISNKNFTKDSCCQEKKTTCCSPKKSVVSNTKLDKTIKIDYLYLDKETCHRCIGTEDVLLESIEEIKSLLTSAGYKIIFNNIHIDSLDKAIKYQFETSPTIRINNQDISIAVEESNCKDCGDICGDDVDCRVWKYQGQTYDVLPKPFIMEALLKAVYAPTHQNLKTKKYLVPANIVKFFSAFKKKE